ncbi:hypothetical protein C1Y40_05748 [Mycobacterium talmoniae]|nr:hypothetical protein C1Y40_05748 [Mycobacterium talmoniae]
MFTEQCDPTNTERVAAVEAVHGYLKATVQRVFPAADPEPMATAAWGLVHGLAFLHLDGKLDTSSAQAVADTVRAAVRALIGQSG